MGTIKSQTTDSFRTKISTEWLRSFKEYKPLDKVPKGWFTRKQLREQLGLSMGYLERLLTKAKESGGLEVRYFRIMNRAGIAMRLPHYHKVCKTKRS